MGFLAKKILTVDNTIAIVRSMSYNPIIHAETCNIHHLVFKNLEKNLLRVHKLIANCIAQRKISLTPLFIRTAASGSKVRAAAPESRAVSGRRSLSFISVLLSMCGGCHPVPVLPLRTFPLQPQGWVLKFLLWAVSGYSLLSRNSPQNDCRNSLAVSFDFLNFLGFFRIFVVAIQINAITTTIAAI